MGKRGPSGRKKLMTDILPFFILGHARSGTTAFARLLNASDRLACMYHESNVLLRLWQMLSRMDIFNEPLDDLVEDFRTTAHHNLHAPSGFIGSRKIYFSSESIEKLVDIVRLSFDGENDPLKIFQRVSRSFFQIFYEHSACRILGDKVPDYSVIPEIVTSPHPACNLLVLHRDPRAVVNSSLMFNKDTLHLFASSNAFAMGVSLALRELALKAFLDEFPGERILQVEHERLLESPGRVAERALTFLDISPLDGGIIDYIDKRIEKESPVRNWQREMSDGDKNAVYAAYMGFGLKKCFADSIKTSGGSFYLDMAMGLNDLFKAPEGNRHSVFTYLNAYCRRESALSTLGFSLTKIADFLHMRGQLNKSKFFFEKALALLPQDPALWFKYGVLCMDTKDLLLSQSAFQKAVSCCPDTGYYRLLQTKIWYYLGRVARLSGDNETAVSRYQKALDVFPDFNLARSMIKMMGA